MISLDKWGDADQAQMDGGLGWLYQGSWDAGYLLSHSSSSGTSTYTGSAIHTHTDVILHMESWITIMCVLVCVYTWLVIHCVSVWVCVCMCIHTHRDTNTVCMYTWLVIHCVYTHTYILYINSPRNGRKCIYVVSVHERLFKCHSYNSSPCKLVHLSQWLFF